MRPESSSLFILHHVTPSTSTRTTTIQPRILFLLREINDRQYITSSYVMSLTHCSRTSGALVLVEAKLGVHLKGQEEGRKGGVIVVAASTRESYRTRLRRNRHIAKLLDIERVSVTVRKYVEEWVWARANELGHLLRNRRRVCMMRLENSMQGSFCSWDGLDRRVSSYRKELEERVVVHMVL